MIDVDRLFRKGLGTVQSGRDAAGTGQRLPHFFLQWHVERNSKRPKGEVSSAARSNFGTACLLHADSRTPNASVKCRCKGHPLKAVRPRSWTKQNGIAIIQARGRVQLKSMNRARFQPSLQCLGEGILFFIIPGSARYPGGWVFQQVT